MSRKPFLAAFSWLLPFAGALAQAYPTGADAGIAGEIRLRLEHLLPEQPLVAAGEPLHSRQVLPTFYEQRLYTPAWSQGAQPSAAAVELATWLRNAGREGLRPAHYHSTTIDQLLASSNRSPSSGALADLDLLLTDAFLLVGAHLVSGRVDPATFDLEWIAYRREVDLAESLERALREQAPSRALDALLPLHSGYRRLRDAYAALRDVAAEGGWPTIAAGPTLRPGDSSERLRELRTRLILWDGAESLFGEAGDIFDERLERAVRSFQARHGLLVDGVVGERTLAALNVPADDRVRQVELNLERWRWLPQDLGPRHVLVNIPDFSLVLAEGESTRLGMRVAVGRSYRRTPVFSDALRYLVLNPSWEVPHRLAVEDKLPEIQRDPTYLQRQGFRVLQGWGKDEIVVDPASVDWSQLSRQRFPYRLRQDPGPLNALGRIKFMFPNRFNVYLHDTPGREVFERWERDVSSGCIRLEKPLELAEALLGSDSGWSGERLAQVVASGQETVVPLPGPVPVHLLYWTTWAEEDGSVHFRRDVYARDELLAQALDKAPATGAFPGDSR